jgi:hypothetical protein
MPPYFTGSLIHIFVDPRRRGKKQTAFVAREPHGTGVVCEQSNLCVENGLNNCKHDIRPKDARHNMDFVVLEKFFNFSNCYIGLQLIIIAKTDMVALAGQIFGNFVDEGATPGFPEN